MTALLILIGCSLVGQIAQVLLIRIRLASPANKSGLTGQALATRLLAGTHCMLGKGQENQYSPNIPAVSLDTMTWHGQSSSALSIAAHECAHHLQHLAWPSLPALRAWADRLQYLAWALAVWHGCWLGLFLILRWVPLAIELHAWHVALRRQRGCWQTACWSSLSYF